jgi:hypothetical protein
VPTLSSFYGIEIRMYWGDHPPPHFHAFFAGHVIVVDIRRVEIIRGEFPHGARLLVLEWTRKHQSELMEAFELCSRQIQPKRIAPLP